MPGVESSPSGLVNPQGEDGTSEAYQSLFMANSQIMLRLECDTTLDSVSASGTSRGLMVTLNRHRPAPAGVRQPGMSSVAVVVILKIE